MKILCFLVLYLLIAGITKNVLKHLDWDTDEIGDSIICVMWPILFVLLLVRIVYYFMTKSSWVDKIGKYIAVCVKKVIE